MNLPCKSCTYSYSLGAYLIYMNIYNFSNVLLFIFYIHFYQNYNFLLVWVKLFINHTYLYLLNGILYRDVTCSLVIYWCVICLLLKLLNANSKLIVAFALPFESW